MIVLVGVGYRTVVADDMMSAASDIDKWKSMSIIKFGW